MMFVLKEILKGIGELILTIAVCGVLFAISPWLALAVFVGGAMIILAEDKAAAKQHNNSER